jgi:hypothetical protein
MATVELRDGIAEPVGSGESVGSVDSVGSSEPVGEGVGMKNRNCSMGPVTYAWT